MSHRKWLLSHLSPFSWWNSLPTPTASLSEVQELAHLKRSKSNMLTLLDALNTIEAYWTSETVPVY